MLADTRKAKPAGARRTPPPVQTFDDDGDEAALRVRLESETVASLKRSLATAEAAKTVGAGTLEQLAHQRDTVHRVEQSLSATEAATAHAESLSATSTCCCGWCEMCNCFKCLAVKAPHKPARQAPRPAPPPPPPPPPLFTKTSAAHAPAKGSDAALDSLSASVAELKVMSRQIGEEVQESAGRLEGLAEGAAHVGGRVKVAHGRVARKL